MPKRRDIDKVLVIGSGPRIMGQAAEFDLAGSQACRVLREEGITSVLINSNPATLLVDSSAADAIYIEPLNVESIRRIIETERPNAIMPIFGGQFAMGITERLADAGILDEYKVELLGLPLDVIRINEGCEEFNRAMQSLNLPKINNAIVDNIEDAISFYRSASFPMSVKPVRSMVSIGSRTARNLDELREFVELSINESSLGRCLLEELKTGYKLIEYELICDSVGTCVSICPMEAVDPMGPHMGDSIMVAPAMTLHSDEDRFLRKMAKKMVRALGIVGCCNIQFAIRQDGTDYYIKSVSPRLSRSSLFAAKATGYPVPQVTARVTLGYKLDEINSSIVDGTNAAIEPMMDYIATKMVWAPFDENTDFDTKTHEIATGEAIGFGANFEQALLKAIRSLGNNVHSLYHPSTRYKDNSAIRTVIEENNNLRIYYIAEALRKGLLCEELNELTGIDMWFLRRLKDIIKLEEELEIFPFDRNLLIKAKNAGLPDIRIAELWNSDETRVREVRHEQDILPKYHIIDSCAGRYAGDRGSVYSLYANGLEEEIASEEQETVVVIGAGAMRVSQGMEYEYNTVHCIRALRKVGVRTVFINCNPEVSSTDVDTADTLYLEPLTTEDIIDILDREKPIGVVVQFGGQEAMRLARSIFGAGYRIMGTSLKDIDNAGDRKEFDVLVDRARIPRPEGRIVMSLDQALDAAELIGYPVLYGLHKNPEGLELAYNEQDVIDGMNALLDKPGADGQQIVVSEYIDGKEIEVDAVCDGNKVLIPGIMEHIERIGTHHGDNISVYPTQSLNKTIVNKVYSYAETLAQMLSIQGLMNIQYIVREDDVYVKELTPIASANAPYNSKVSSLPALDIAVRVCLGETLEQIDCGTGMVNDFDTVAIKAPVYTCTKSKDEKAPLGLDIKASGDVMGVDEDFAMALLKAMTGSGLKMPRCRGGRALLTVADGDKAELIRIAEMLLGMDYELIATAGTAHYLNRCYIGCDLVRPMSEASPNILDLVKEGVDLIIFTPHRGQIIDDQQFLVKKMAIANNTFCLTNMRNAAIIVEKIKKNNGELIPPAKLLLKGDNITDGHGKRL